MRAFVRKHPDYQQDSVVPPRAADLLKAAHRIGLGLERCPEMHGDFPMPPIATTDAYAVPLRRDPSRKLGGGDLDALVDSYAQRTELLARRRKLQAEVARARRARRDAVRAGTSTRRSPTRSPRRRPRRPTTATRPATPASPTAAARSATASRAGRRPSAAASRRASSRAPSDVRRPCTFCPHSCAEVVCVAR